MTTQQQQLTPEQAAWQQRMVSYHQAIANAITARNLALQNCRALVEYCSQALPQYGVQDQALYQSLQQIWQQIESIQPIHVDPNMPPAEMTIPAPAAQQQTQQHAAQQQAAQQAQQESPRLDIRDAGMRGVDAGRVTHDAREASPKEAVERVRTAGLSPKPDPASPIDTRSIEYTPIPDGIRIKTR